jgi:16S rRNA (guanine527-N7)-methyltransferase
VQADFGARARSLGVALDEAQLQHFSLYRDSIVSSAREFNLTAVRDAAGVETRHLLESLAFGVLLSQRGLLEGSPRVIDVGSGAGLPGLPLKLAWPQIELTLLEATAKKCRFLESVAAALGLERVRVVEARAEEAGHDPELRGRFDVAVARAVAPLPVLIEYCLPLLGIDGVMAASKGSAAAREIAAASTALRELGGVLIETVPFHPPDVAPQTLVFVRKAAPTPERYPRRTGIPSKRPLA